MIVFKRLGGEIIALNPDLIERVEATPDTVVTMLDDKKFLVDETLEEVLRLITDYRAYVIARANDLTVAQTGGRPTLHVVPNELIASSEITETYGSDPEGLDLEFEGIESSPVDLAFESALADDTHPEGLVHLEFGERQNGGILEGDASKSASDELSSDGVDLAIGSSEPYDGDGPGADNSGPLESANGDSQADLGADVGGVA